MSKENPLQKYTLACISDVLSCFGVPTAVASQIYADVLQKRGAEALEILFSEIRQGHFKNIDQHEVISIIARFQRDAMEGVARNNLRIMARVLNGMAEKQQLKAPTFLKYANIIASLTEEEITVLGIMAKHTRQPVALIPVPHVHNNMLVYGDALHDELKVAIPHYLTVQQALVRTGLLNFTVDAEALNRLEAAPDAFPSQMVSMTRKLHFHLTPLMDEILKFTPNFGEGN